MTHFPPVPELHKPEEAAAMSPETCLLQLSVSKQSPAVSSGGHRAGILAASRIWAAEATCLAGTEWFLETDFLRVRNHALGDATAPPSLREPPPLPARASIQQRTEILLLMFFYLYCFNAHSETSGLVL